MIKSNHFYGLDAARALLLLGGPIIHSWMDGYPLHGLGVVQEASKSFRMGAFFMIAGFLVAISPKTRHETWLSARFRQLFVPLVTVGAVLAITVRCLVLMYPERVPDASPFPGHLWFLMVLLIVSPFSVLAGKYNWDDRIGNFVDNFPYSFVGISIILSIILALYQTMFPVPVLDDPLTRTSLSIEANTPKFLVMYIFGYGLALSPKATARLGRWWVNVTAVSFLLATVMLWIIFRDQFTVERPFGPMKYPLLALESITQSLMGLAIITTALHIKRIPPIISWLGNAAYSVYLFHLVFIILVSYMLTHWIPTISPALLYVVLVASSLGLSCLAHVLISQSRSLRFLFNGRAL